MSKHLPDNPADRKNDPSAHAVGMSKHLPDNPSDRKNDPSAHAAGTPTEPKDKPIDTEEQLLKDIPGKSIGAVVRRLAARCRSATHMGAAFPTCLANALEVEAQFLEPIETSITVDEAKTKVEALRREIGASLVVIEDTGSSAAARVEALEKISKLEIKK